MKRLKRSLVALLVTAFSLFALSGCGETTYSVASNFFYSSDKGHTYGDGTKEYAVGDTVYMKVRFKVTSSDKKVSQVKVVLSIPSIQNVDAKYLDGQIITPNYDAIKNVTTYEFTANASNTAVDQDCVIQFIPNAVGEVAMTLEFDDNVDPSYDRQSTLIFVEKTDDTAEAEE